MKKIQPTTKKPSDHSPSKATTNLHLSGTSCFKAKVVPSATAIKDTASNKTVSNNTASNNTATNSNVSNNTVSNDTASNNTTNVINGTVASRFRHLQINIDQYRLIWVDKDVNATKDNLNIQKKLREIISNLQVFDHVEEFKKYMKDINSNEKVVLLISGSYGRQIVPNVQNCTQVVAIYVYCTNESANREWSKPYDKVSYIVSYF